MDPNAVGKMVLNRGGRCWEERRNSANWQRWNKKASLDAAPPNGHPFSATAGEREEASGSCENQSQPQLGLCRLRPPPPPAPRPPIKD